MAPTDKNILAELVNLLVATMFAFALLTYSSLSAFTRANLDKQNTMFGEMFQGKAFTATKVKNIKALIDERQVSQTGASCNHFYCILWLGNSRLHYIRQFKEGDHSSPYWLRMFYKDPACFEPLGLSLPGAQMEEFLVLSRYAANRIQLNLLVIDVGFEGFRGDGLRYDFKDMLDVRVKNELRYSSPVAEDIVKRYEVTRNNASDLEAKEALAGTIQEPVERWLDDSLSEHWRLWAIRPEIERHIKDNLVLFRNYLFGAHVTSARLLPTSYERNLAALRDILADCRDRRIPVLMYIGPFPNNKPTPYNRADWNRWKSELQGIAEQFGANFVNLERSVPDEYWGTDVEGLAAPHFQGPAHRCVAEALMPQVLQIIKKRAH